MTRRVRVAVLGGGCGGMAAAAWLSATEARRRRFEVTVYQPGFRLGGKGATGRNARHGQRIEEHGLHIWMGFYRRSFAMMRSCYDEWRPPSHTPIRTLEEAFAPSASSTLLGLDHGGACDLWPMRLPPRPGRPWDSDDERVDWLAYARALMSYGAQGASDTARTLVGGGRDLGRRLSTLARLSSVIARGLLLDVLPYGEPGFDRIDHLDLREWLARHGALDPEVNDAPPIRGMYNLAFAYPDGIGGFGRGAIAAGAALKSLLLILGAYRGAPFWRMRAGMGDTVFAPLYQVLRAQGVRFRFFHRVEQLRLAHDRRQVRAIELGVQARVKGGAYDPLVDVRGQPCWPSEPRWEQLDDGERLRAAGVDFESNTRPYRQERAVLEHGRDFDEVVLAIPSLLHRQLAEDLYTRDDRYRAMVDNTHGVAIRALQLWLRPSQEALGWSGPPALVTNLPGAFGTWADMSDVLDSEAWTERPGSVAYFCDACPEPWVSAGDARARAHAAAARWLDEHGPRVWPGALRSGRSARELLVGDAPFDDDDHPGRYLRINSDPTDRYLLSLPGTTRFRLRPDESGVENLVLAGDWTRTRINGGSVEAAVESGQRAASALCDRSGVP